jgi:MFS transporter, Spinster family, sphingosine-1-phosphate transporter
MFYSLPQALGASALQLATPGRMRGIASAVYVFAVSIVGLGGAPTLVALITDQVLGDEKRVGVSLAITCGVAALLAVFFLWRCRRHYLRLSPSA